LKNKTGSYIYSAARHGSGIYDFYYFVKSVPKKSKIILSISEHTQIRPDINEANTSPLDLSSLKKIYSSDYSIAGFKNILKRGIKLPRANYFKTQQNLYPYNDSINLHTQLPIFDELYSKSTSEKINYKQDMYIKGIKSLIEKDCNITFIEFPYNKDLSNLESKTRLNKRLNVFRKRVSEEYNNFKIDTFFLNSNKNLMYDYTHLNNQGAFILTQILAEKINASNFNITTMFIVKQCE